MSLKGVHSYWLVKLILILYITILVPTVLFSNYNISLSRVSPDTLLLSLEFKKPSFIEYSSSSFTNQSKIFLPDVFKSFLIVSQSASIDAEIVAKQIRKQKTFNQVFLVNDVSIGLKNEYEPLSKSRNIIEKRYLGQADGEQLFQLRIYPYENSQWIRKLKLKITGNNVKIVSDVKKRFHFLNLFSQKRKIFPQVTSSIPYKKFSPDNSFPKLKILVDHEGIFLLPQPMIVSAGWDVSSIDPRFFKIVGPSGEIPIRVIGEEDGSFDINDAVEFWGEPLWDRSNSDGIRLNIFATKNVYWLELGEKPGLRLGQEEAFPPDINPQSIVTSRSYPFTKHMEKDVYFARLPYATNVDQADHWLFSGPIVGGEKKEFSFKLDSPDLYATDLAVIRIKMRGQSQVLQVHPVEIYLNDKRVASGEWQSNQSIVLESTGFSPTFLKTGENHLTIVNRSEAGEFAQLYLDWFEITYPKLYQANNDYIRFRAPKYSTGKISRFEISGFSRPDIEVYKNGISKIFAPKVDLVTDSLGQTTYRVTFQDRIVDERTEYIALIPEKKSIPDSVTLVEDAGLLSDNGGADYIIIVPSDSLEKSLEDLVKLRESQGHVVKVVKLDDIYNTFSHGLPLPDGIREFLRYALSHWSLPPKYVLLVGDGTINNRASPEQGNLIPVPIYQTVKYGAAASDHWYTLLKGNDDLPDIAIGRLPIRNIQELENIVAKIVNYQKSAPAPWKNRYLLIGTDPVFRTQSETLIRDVISPSFEPERLYLCGNPSDPYVGGTEDLLSYLKDGVLFVNFRGHGGGAIWGKLLNLDDAELIDNKGKLPVISSMTCFTADFASGRKSLGEVMVLNKEKGAVAFWGATGIGWILNDYYLLTEFYNIMMAQPDLTLGEMIMKAKTFYLSTHGGSLPLSEVYQFTLLGDPALKISIPEEKRFTLSNQSLSYRDTIHVSGKSDIEKFNMLVEVVEENRSANTLDTLTFDNGEWQANVLLPPDFKDSEGGIRAYLWDPQTEYHTHGFVPFTVGKVFFDSLRTVPEEPSSNDTIRFSVVAKDISALGEVWCKIVSPQEDSLAMFPADNSGKYQTAQGVGPFLPGTRVSFYFVAKDKKGFVSYSDTVTFSIPTLPDLRVQSLALAGTEQVMLEAHIRNFGEEKVPCVSVLFQSPRIGFSAKDTISISGYGEAIASVPFSPLMGEMDLTVTIDPDSVLPEKNRTNNIFHGKIKADRFNVTPQGGSCLGSTLSDTVGLPGQVMVFIPPGAVSKKTVLSVVAVTDQDTAHSGIQTGNMYRLILYGEDQTPLSKSAAIDFLVPKGKSSKKLKPYRWEKSIQKWVVYPFSHSDSLISIKSKIFGLFGLLNFEDNEPPLIELQVENQPFSEGSYVPRNPVITVIIQDKFGVDMRPGRVEIFLDGELQDFYSLVLPDSTNDPTNITVLFKPHLKPGKHVIYAKAYDVNGNIGQSDKIDFRVGSRLEIHFLGNHPNPFQRETIFAYLLTDAAKEVSLKIYTVAGKLIRSFNDFDMASPDYHEVVWDGRDEWGEEVANGVYFFRIIVHGDQGDREVTGKIAKIK